MKPCWSCAALLEAAAVACSLCGEPAIFGSAPSLINEAEELVRKLSGVLAHMENSARRHGARSLEIQTDSARALDLKALFERIEKLRAALRRDGERKRAA